MAKDIPLVIGIDEAGRGPVLGDMIIALVTLKENKLADLKNLGIKDSKLLTPDQRKKLVPYIISNSVFTAVAHVSTLEIDTYNINQLVFEKITELLYASKNILGNYRVKRIVVDMVKGFKKYINKYREVYPTAEILFVEKADLNYTEVAAASIIAKYYRDSMIDYLNKIYGNIGSGYPTDPRTINWIKKVASLETTPPAFVRKTWSILKRIAPNWYKQKSKYRSKSRKNKTLLEYLS